MTRLALLVALGACSVQRIEPQPTGENALFPHPDDFARGEVHGARARERRGICRACHDHPSTPGCTDCHAAYPHAVGWVTAHGASVLAANDELAACEACHATEGLFATRELACDACHTSWPHPPGWAAAGRHGAHALAAGGAEAVCGTCHGADLRGGDVGIACDDCHGDWPHGPSWRTDHGSRARQDLGTCATCHARDGAWDGGPTGAACSGCHAAYPHPADWSREHAPWVARAGEAVCAGCHGPGSGPPEMVATCARSCHGGTE